MDLNINSPAYFSRQYFIDNDVYRFCQKAYLFFKDKEYSDTLHTIGIIPVAAPQELYDNGAWEESVEFRNNKSVACITIRMDFNEYYNADSAKKIQLIKETILEAVKRIKSKGKFDYEAFAEDFNTICTD